MRHVPAEWNNWNQQSVWDVKVTWLHSPLTIFITWLGNNLLVEEEAENFSSFPPTRLKMGQKFPPSLDYSMMQKKKRTCHVVASHSVKLKLMEPGQGHSTWMEGKVSIWQTSLSLHQRKALLLAKQQLTPSFFFSFWPSPDLCLADRVRE